MKMILLAKIDLFYISGEKFRDCLTLKLKIPFTLTDPSSLNLFDRTYAWKQNINTI